jgi:hypothetical protein
MTSIGKQRRRVHKPPSSAFRTREDNICTQSNKCDATASVTFTEKEGNELGASIKKMTDSAHLRFATSQSTPRRGRGHANANASVLRRCHGHASASWTTVHGHDARIARLL